VWEIVAAPVRWWRRLAGKLRRTGTAGDHGARVPSAPLGAERTPPAPDSGSLGNYRPSR
jgi:hypothetical protein